LHFWERYCFAFFAALTRGQTMKREKHFGEGRSIPLDRNAKARVLILAQSFLHRMRDGSEKPKGKAYGALTAKYFAVLQALLLGFHNSKNGRCFPSYDTVAERAGCSRSTYALAIIALEDLGIMTWVNRVYRGRVPDPDMTDLLGQPMTRIRVLRTSNAYTFNDPHPCAFVGRSTKSDLQSGTPIPFFTSTSFTNVVPFDQATVGLDPANPLHAALIRMRTALVAPTVDHKA
jgi:hypothetical protein